MTRKDQTTQVSIVLLVISAICMNFASNFSDYHRMHYGGRRANTRACFAHIKIIAACIEMYNMDNPANPFPSKASELTPYFVDKFVDAGYVQSIPVHPGDQMHPSEAYGFAEDGMIFCFHHGFIQHELRGNGSAYDQLIASGESRIEVLARASRKRPQYSEEPQVSIVIIFPFVAWIFFATWSLRRWRRHSNIKYALLIFILFLTYFGKMWRTAILGYVFWGMARLILVTLFLDMIIFSVRLLFSGTLIAILKEKRINNFFVKKETAVNRVTVVVGRLVTYYSRTTFILALVALVSIVAFLVVGHPVKTTTETMSSTLAPCLLLFFAGVVTGVVRFWNLLDNTTELDASGNFIHLSYESIASKQRAILTGIIVIPTVCLLIVSILFWSKTYIAASAFSLLLIASPLGGRHLAIWRFSEKYLTFIKSI